MAIGLLEEVGCLVCERKGVTRKANQPTDFDGTILENKMKREGGDESV